MERIRKNKIKLGDEVQDKLTPFKGIVIGLMQWIYGCDRVGVMSVELKDGMPLEPFWFDETQVKVIKKKKVARNKSARGGPRMKNPTRIVGKIR